MTAEAAAEIHAYQRAALLVVTGKHNMIIVNSVVFKTLAYVPVLARLSAAVYALENYQLTFCHNFLR